MISWTQKLRWTRNEADRKNKEWLGLGSKETDGGREVEVEVRLKSSCNEAARQRLSWSLIIAVNTSGAIELVRLCAQEATSGRSCVSHGRNCDSVFGRGAAQRGDAPLL